MAQRNLELYSVHTNGVAWRQMAQCNVEWYSVHTNGVALREMAQRNVEWYNVHTNGVALREMAQRYVEWYGIHTNGVALHEMAQRYIEWYSVLTNSVALREMAWRNVEWYSLHTSLQNIRRSNWTLNRLVLHEIFRFCGESSSLLMAWREDNLAETKFKFNCASVLHNPLVHAHDISKQIPREKKISLTIGSYVGVRSSRCEARGKFGEHERCIRVARGVTESNSSFLSALQTSQVLHISTNAQLTHEPIGVQIPYGPEFFSGPIINYSFQ